MDNEKIDRDSLPELEELMPGEDLHSTRPPDHEEFMDYDLRTKEIFMGEDIRKSAARKKITVRTKELLVLIFIFSIVYVYVMSTGHMSKELLTLAVMTPMPYGIIIRMVTNKMDFREAARSSKPYFVLTVLHLISSIVIYIMLR